MYRAKLAQMGPSAQDMTATQIQRRADLEERIRATEAEVAEQLALPVDPDLELLRPEDLDPPAQTADGAAAPQRVTVPGTEPEQRHLRLVR